MKDRKAKNRKERVNEKRHEANWLDRNVRDGAMGANQGKDKAIEERPKESSTTNNGGQQKNRDVV